MRRTTLALTLAAAVGAVAVTAAQAHHSVSAQFDTDGQVKTAVATLKKVEWINPHPYMTFEITGANGTAVDWPMESQAPAALRRAGLAGREALKVGTKYPIYYYPARNGKPVGLLMAFTLPDGRTIGALAGKDLEAVKAAQAK
jgi:hypothetical protein